MTYEDFESFAAFVLYSGLFACLVGMIMVFMKTLWCGGL